MHQLAGAAAFAFGTVLIAWNAETRMALYVIGAWILLPVAGYAVRRTRTPQTPAAAPPGRRV